MFKKINLNILAATLAVVAVIIGTIASRQEAKASPFFASFYWQIDNPASPLAGASYSAISQSAYNSISCSGTTKVCKLQSSSATLPATMTDANSDNVPDVTGSVVSVPRKN